MDLIAIGEPVNAHEDDQVDVGVHLRPGSLVLTREREDFEAFHALVKFASPRGEAWTAQEVRFSAKGPGGRTVGLTMDLLNDACDGPRASVPRAVWKVVALAATSAGDVGITYASPGAA